MFRRAAVCGALLVASAGVFVAVLGSGPAQIATLVVAVVSEAAASITCLWSARRAAPGDRRWRVLIGIFAAGLGAGGLLTLVKLLSTGSVVGNVTSEYSGLIVFYGLALAGLLSLPTCPFEDRGARRFRGGPSRWHVIVVLDSVLIVGSVLLVEWGTSLEGLVRTRSPDPAEVAFALVHQVAALILTATVLLIGTFRRPRSPATLALLGAGLLAYALTNGLLVYRFAHGDYDLPGWSLLPIIVSLQLITLAALVPVRGQGSQDGEPMPDPRAMWAHAALPYAVLGVAGVLILTRLVAGAPLDRVEAYGTVSLLVLALARQMMTIAENTHLLAEVRVRERQLRHQAFHDPLTGLANRALFSRRLARAVGPGNAPGGDGDTPGGDGALAGREAVAVLFVDLDHFKGVNDAFGHAIGDELLKISAARLRGAVRATDTVARLGGDEFAVILDGDGADEPVQLAQRLAAAVEAPCKLAGRRYDPRASLGLVTLDRAAGPTCPDTLLHQADLAMYAAKRERSRRLVVYDPALSAGTVSRT
ncbi:GGDEF domain-containing protein [Frankia sp. AgB1.9]|uniref:GGDEF domain-containing protein n=1 Tax=unclassified Frankia TaxID=2632575 RepID=UPI00193316A2|nr:MULTISPECIES: GGDEF domain-containing protein [unclassified Frankia]MBL7490238.1 GGDEF domain-containing protein [Frankia sp. AgW1.1]MBL7548631.1 GGDEF domain-containing protein [Frankia sp. AgB1.9]MBL7623490.1 GGDEF domain-containing protein [Frankia sp. AgB1.8]